MLDGDDVVTIPDTTPAPSAPPGSGWGKLRPVRLQAPLEGKRTRKYRTLGNGLNCLSSGMRWKLALLGTWLAGTGLVLVNVPPRGHGSTKGGALPPQSVYSILPSLGEDNRRTRVIVPDGLKWQESSGGWATFVDTLEFGNGYFEYRCIAQHDDVQFLDSYVCYGGSGVFRNLVVLRYDASTRFLDRLAVVGLGDRAPGTLELTDKRIVLGGRIVLDHIDRLK